MNETMIPTFIPYLKVETIFSFSLLCITNYEDCIIFSFMLNIEWKQEKIVIFVVKNAKLFTLIQA